MEPPQVVSTEEGQIRPLMKNEIIDPPLSPHPPETQIGFTGRLKLFKF